MAKQYKRGRPGRLPHWDYGSVGYYFLTFCTEGRQCILSQIIETDGCSSVARDDPGARLPRLTPLGVCLQNYLNTLSLAYPNITLHHAVIMPNHVHLLVSIDSPTPGAPGSSRPTQLIPRMIAALKRFTNQQAGFNLWQSTYHDHIIRNEADYRRIWGYIADNPAKWREDCYFVTEKEIEMAKKEEKTNVMRILEQKKIAYVPHAYPHGEGEAPDGVSVARSLGLDPAQVFKTLVTKGASGGYYVFDIPVADTLDLKKAAKAVGEKSVAMLHSKELLPLTGYVHGGCSPIGMKKLFPTVFHKTALEQETIFVSAGKIGLQVELSPADLMKLVRGNTADVTAEA